MANIQMGRGLSHGDVHSYVDKITMLSHDRRPRLLVEGPDDVRFFESLRVRLDLEEVIIEHADFRIPGREENRRENVEYAAKTILSNHPIVARRFLGFADREFDWFDCTHIPTADLSNGQQQIDRLMYSRGHSIENYVFKYELIEDSLRFYFPTSSNYRDAALGLMQEHFEGIIRIASLISLAALQEKLIGKSNEALRNLRTWDSNRSVLIYDESADSVELNETEFRNRLLDESVDPSRVSDFLDKYRQYRGTVGASADEAIERWFCHGHIGIHLIRVAYAMFIYNSWYKSQSGSGTPPISLIDSMLNKWDWIEERNNAFSWVDFYCNYNDARTSPTHCFKELGLL